VPEVQLSVAVDVSVGDVLVESGDVVIKRPLVANAPSQVESEPLSSDSPSMQSPIGSNVVPEGNVSAPGSTTRGDVVAGERRRGVRRTTGSLRVPMLEPDVKALLESQVGQFTHALCAPLRDPVYVDPTDSNQAMPAVKSAPGERDHVLCLGTNVGQLTRLLRVFHCVRRDVPSVQGTFVVPFCPSAMWWNLLPDHRVCEFVPHVRLFAKGRPVRRVYVVVSTVQVSEDPSTSERERMSRLRRAPLPNQPRVLPWWGRTNPKSNPDR